MASLRLDRMGNGLSPKGSDLFTEDDVLGGKLDFVLAGIDLHFFRPNGNNVSLQVLVYANKKILFIGRKACYSSFTIGISSCSPDLGLQED